MTSAPITLDRVFRDWLLWAYRLYFPCLCLYNLALSQDVCAEYVLDEMFGFTAILLAVCLTQSHHLIDFLPLVWFRWRGLPFLSLSLGRVGWKQQRQKFAPPPSTPSGQPRNPAGGPQRDTSRTDLQPEMNGLASGKRIYSRGSQRVDSVPGRSVVPGAPRKNWRSSRWGMNIGHDMMVLIQLK